MESRLHPPFGRCVPTSCQWPSRHVHLLPHSGVPSVHYGENQRRKAGDRTASERTLTGTTLGAGELCVRGYDLRKSQDGLVVRKDPLENHRPDSVTAKGSRLRTPTKGNTRPGEMLETVGHRTHLQIEKITWVRLCPPTG